MKTLVFSVEIFADSEHVWKTLWENESYTCWTKPFTEGCTYETEAFAEGNDITFLSPTGDGMSSKIVSYKHREFVAFEHFGMIVNGVKSTFKAEDDHHQYLETYQLEKNENSVTLTVKVDTLEPWEAMMSTSFPQALKIIKELSEQ
ncbi:MAG: hypothetical protein IT216_00700 [Saprospiraceae bacterium]|nr:MAG: Activator of Hsp90 ATPase 1 family protein [Candidatus Parvibacillus calidus]MCC7147714.1 hypothetical protein [Saprospiraceae bacterium]